MSTLGWSVTPEDHSLSRRPCHLLPGPLMALLFQSGTRRPLLAFIWTAESAVPSGSSLRLLNGARRAPLSEEAPVSVSCVPDSRGFTQQRTLLRRKTTAMSSLRHSTDMVLVATIGSENLPWAPPGCCSAAGQDHSSLWILGCWHAAHVNEQAGFEMQESGPHCDGLDA